MNAGQEFGQSDYFEIPEAITKAKDIKDNHGMILNRFIFYEVDRKDPRMLQELIDDVFPCLSTIFRRKEGEEWKKIPQTNIDDKDAPTNQFVAKADKALKTATMVASQIGDPQNIYCKEVLQRCEEVAAQCQALRQVYESTIAKFKALLKYLCIPVSRRVEDKKGVKMVKDYTFADFCKDIDDLFLPNAILKLNTNKTERKELVMKFEGQGKPFSCLDFRLLWELEEWQTKVFNKQVSRERVRPRKRVEIGADGVVKRLPAPAAGADLLADPSAPAAADLPTLSDWAARGATSPTDGERRKGDGKGAGKKGAAANVG